MKSTSCSIGLLLAVILLACYDSHAVAQSPNEDLERPNILLVLCDDLGYSDVGFNGSKEIKTPALDQLARAGTVFSSAYVTHPFCGPSRMGLMAGRYAHAFGGPFNLPNPNAKGMEDCRHLGIPVSETLISTVLQKSGYFTGVVGKWHMGIAPEYHPNRRGFDDFYGFLGGGHMYFPEKYLPVYQRQIKAGKEFVTEYAAPIEHNGEIVEETQYMTDALSRESVRFIKQAAEKDQPFFLFVSYNAPHTPLEAKEADLKHYNHIADKKRRTYCAMVHAVDRGVGQIVKALEQTEAMENTLIVFLSDNGGKLGAGATNHPLAEGKGSIFEGGFRVPMFFHWPKIVPAGDRYDHPISALDFYPTFAGLTKSDIPKTKLLDGKDIWQDFLAGKNARPNETIFAIRHNAAFSNVGARRGKWKLIHTGGEKIPWKLFDLENDVEEKQDVSKQHPDIGRDMVGDVKNWTKTHTTPKWFHALTARQQWQQNNMPNNRIFESE